MRYDLGYCVVPILYCSGKYYSVLRGLWQECKIHIFYTLIQQLLWLRIKKYLSQVTKMSPKLLTYLNNSQNTKIILFTCSVDYISFWLMNETKLKWYYKTSGLNSCDGRIVTDSKTACDCSLLLISILILKRHNDEVTASEHSCNILHIFDIHIYILWPGRWLKPSPSLLFNGKMAFSTSRRC